MPKLRNFLETQTFAKTWASEDMTDEDLRGLQATLTLNPNVGDSLDSTGLRKLRVAAKQKGKRSGGRVIYANFDEYSYTVLVAFYSKNTKIDLTPQEKKQFKDLLERLEKAIIKDFFKKKKKG